MLLVFIKLYSYYKWLRATCKLVAENQSSKSYFSGSTYIIIDVESHLGVPSISLYHFFEIVDLCMIRKVTIADGAALSVVGDNQSDCWVR